MEFWHGYMSWSLKPGWTCFICGDSNLIWGLVHSICRCDTCHTHYRMRQDTISGPIIDVPQSTLRPELREAFIRLYKEYKQPIELIPTWEWDHIPYKEEINEESETRIPEAAPRPKAPGTTNQQTD